MVEWFYPRCRVRIRSVARDAESADAVVLAKTDDLEYPLGKIITLGTAPGESVRLPHMLDGKPDRWVGMEGHAVLIKNTWHLHSIQIPEDADEDWRQSGVGDRAAV